MKRIPTSLVVVLTFALFLPERADGADWIARGRRGIVATDSYEASRAGLEILRSGGNAFDAAVAVSSALGVTRPYSTGAGGGGLLLARLADGRLLALDYRETAPAAAGPNLYTTRSTKVPALGASRVGGLAVAVPGMVAGQCHFLEHHGTLPLKTVLQPAIRLARDGFAVDDHHLEAMRRTREIFELQPALRETCRYVYEVQLNNGRLFKIGETLKQPRLAAFLEQLSEQGRDFVYRGAFARDLVATLAARGGVIEKSDLENYRVRPRHPLTSSYRDATIVCMPPPSSGGIAMIEILNILEPLDLPTLRQRDEVLVEHYIIEAMKHAFADRARWLGDSDFVEVPVAFLTSKDYGRRLSQALQPRRALDVQRAGSPQLPDDSGTSHYCIVDSFGNAVAASETINTRFGSLVAVEPWGVILNNEMDDFTTVHGESNAFGLQQSPGNTVAPGKRPLSSMSPTLVLRDDQVVLLLGGSGGPRIISSVLHVMLNVLDFGMTLEAAMTAPRSHHQWSPDEVFFYHNIPSALAEGLITRGHRLSTDRRTGIVQAIWREGRLWTAASDPRKGGRPAAY